MTAPRIRNLVIGALALFGAFVLLVIVTTQMPPSPQETTNSTQNSHARGAKAVAQLLRANGVAVTEVTRLDDAIGAARPGSTLAIVLSANLSEDALARLAEAPADLVLIETMPYTTNLMALTGDIVGSSQADSPPKKVYARCSDPDATAAGSVTTGGVSLYVGQDPDRPATMCFGFGQFSEVLYADLPLPGHRVTVLAGDHFVRNGTLADEGNAALALRALGRNATLTWYLPGTDAQPGGNFFGEDDDIIWTLFPGWARPAFAVALAAAAAAAFWRGRRFGKLVPETLPVAVPAAEAAAGLGRLYRQSHACGHAAAALRAATAARVASRLGLPPSSPPEVVVPRIADATHADANLVGRLIYGPAPATDDELLALATSLRQLENTMDGAVRPESEPK